MQRHKGTWKGIFLSGIFLVLSAGCSTPANLTSGTTDAQSAGITLTPFIQNSKTPAPELLNEATPAPLPSPSPTPITHTVTAGESFGSIAVKYGSTVDALILANPTIDPNALPVGTVLAIPAVSADGVVNSVMPSPVPVTLQVPDCWQDVSSRIICFVGAANPSPNPVEGVSASLRYQAADGSIREITAFTMLNRIPAGSSVPLYAVFASDKDWDGNMAVELKTAIPAPDGGQAVGITGSSTVIGESGFSATVTGTITSQDGGVSYWVLLVSRNSSGAITGARRFTVSIPAGETSTGFSFQVFSFSGEIESVDVLAEPAP